MENGKIAEVRQQVTLSSGVIKRLGYYKRRGGIRDHTNVTRSTDPTVRLSRIRSGNRQK